MTIVTCVKVRDGLVLGTDSMAHIQRGGQFLRSYRHATKLFQVGTLPVGAMSYGLGNIGHRSIESLMREFGDKLKANQKSVAPVSVSLCKFMKGHYDSLSESLSDGEELPELGFLVAGYSPGQVFAEVREFRFPGDSKPRTTMAKEMLGACWRGVEAPFFRLAMGYGFLVRQRLEAAGLDEEVAGELLDDLGIDVVFDGMPVQDAVEYSTFILNTTIGYTTFSMELSPCGGPLQVATILPDRTFNWLAKPEVHMKEGF
jgi:hypothetical protein